VYSPRYSQQQTDVSGDPFAANRSELPRLNPTQPNRQLKSMQATRTRTHHLTPRYPRQHHTPSLDSSHPASYLHFHVSRARSYAPRPPFGGRLTSPYHLTPTSTYQGRKSAWQRIAVRGKYPLDIGNSGMSLRMQTSHSPPPEPEPGRNYPFFIKSGSQPRGPTFYPGRNCPISLTPHTSAHPGCANLPKG
jgi:hypothetical protein